MSDIHGPQSGYTSMSWANHTRHQPLASVTTSSSHMLSSTPSDFQSYYRQLPPIFHTDTSQHQDASQHTDQGSDNWSSQSSEKMKYENQSDTMSICTIPTRPSSPGNTPRRVPIKKTRSPLHTKDIHVEKNTQGKPPYSYATLIKYAIEHSPQKKLTLSDIYQWVIEHYPYYATAGNGWKNSIRHNLSLNKSFVRVPRPINEPGKGSYWTVDHHAAENEQRVRQALRTRVSRSGSDPAPSPFRPESVPTSGRNRCRDVRALSADAAQLGIPYYAGRYPIHQRPCETPSGSSTCTYLPPASAYHHQQPIGHMPAAAAAAAATATVPNAAGYGAQGMHTYYQHPSSRSSDPSMVSVSNSSFYPTMYNVYPTNTNAPGYHDHSNTMQPKTMYSQETRSPPMNLLPSSSPVGSVPAWSSHELSTCQSSETSSDLSLATDSLDSPQPQHFSLAACMSSNNNGNRNQNSNGSNNKLMPLPSPTHSRLGDSSTLPVQHSSTAMFSYTSTPSSPTPQTRLSQ